MFVNRASGSRRKRVATIVVLGLSVVAGCTVLMALWHADAILVTYYESKFAVYPTLILAAGAAPDTAPEWRAIRMLARDALWRRHALGLVCQFIFVDSGAVDDQARAWIQSKVDSLGEESWLEIRLQPGDSLLIACTRSSGYGL